MGEQVLGDVQQAGHEDMRMTAEAMHSTLNCVHGSHWLQLSGSNQVVSAFQRLTQAPQGGALCGLGLVQGAW